MKKIQSGEVEFYQFDLLKNLSPVTHAIFTRRGGVSPYPFRSLNVSYHSGDEEDRVHKNRTIVKAVIGAKHLVSGQQVHNSVVKVIDQVPTAEDELPGTDALLTDLPDVALMTKHADCQAVILYDPERKAAGNIHCGWRGNVLNIIGHTVEAMVRSFGARPQDIIACIGPSLGPCCAEFKNFRREFPPALWRYEIAPDYFDLWAISRDQLLGAGILPEHIELARMCTKCQPDDFFSYRGEKVTGRFGTVVALSNGR